MKSLLYFFTHLGCLGQSQEKRYCLPFGSYHKRKGPMKRAAHKKAGLENKFQHIPCRFLPFPLSFQNPNTSNPSPSCIQATKSKSKHPFLHELVSTETHIQPRKFQKKKCKRENSGREKIFVKKKKKP